MVSNRCAQRCARVVRLADEMGHRDGRERRRPIARMTAERNASTGRPSIARLALVGALDPLAAPFGRVEDRGEERLRMPDAPVLELEDLDHVPARAVRVARSEDARVPGYNGLFAKTIDVIARCASALPGSCELL